MSRWSLQAHPARPASVSRNLLKTLGQTLGMWFVFFLVAPASIYAIEAVIGIAPYRWAGQWVLGAVTFGSGGALALWSGWTLATLGEGTPWPLDSPRVLVIAGPYRYVRNPMAAGSLTQGAGVAFALGSPLVLLYVFAGVIVWQCFARPWEERHLMEQFGEPYIRYREGVRCWFPRLTPYRGDRDATQTSASDGLR